MGKFPQHSLATKRKRNANAQKCRLPCVKSEMTACLGNYIGQKKHRPQIERKGLFFGLGKGNSAKKKPRATWQRGLQPRERKETPRKKRRKTLRKLTPQAQRKGKPRSRSNHLFSWRGNLYGANLAARIKTKQNRLPRRKVGNPAISAARKNRSKLPILPGEEIGLRRLCIFVVPTIGGNQFGIIRNHFF